MHDNQLGARMVDQGFDGSFYSRFRYAAILLKLHGLFPFENGSNDGRSLSFKWFGWNSLWGFALHATISIVLYRLSLDENANRPLLYGYLYQINVFYLALIANSGKFVTSIGILEDIHDEISSWTADEVLPATSSRSFFLTMEITLICIFGLRESVFVLTESPNLETGCKVLTILIGTFTSIQEVYVSVLFLIVVFHMTESYNKLNAEMIATMERSHNHSALARFEHLRILHANLSDASDYLYEWFGVTLVCIFGTLVAKTLLKVYLITIVFGKISLVKDFSTFIFVSVYLVVLTFASQQLVDSNKKIGSITKNPSSLGLSSTFQFQSRLAMLQTTALPLNTMALGLFNTTRTLIPSILSVIAVYITVIVELETPLEIFAILLKRRDSHFNVTNK